MAFLRLLGELRVKSLGLRASRCRDEIAGILEGALNY